MALSDPVDLTGKSPRDRILLTAHDLFYREGIRATGIDRVIAEAGVTKVTFYRHFPSKNKLIIEFLNYRHERWMTWFVDALERHNSGKTKGAAALVPALNEWFSDPGYRGCAFLNSVGEVGAAIPEVVEISRGHKQDMTAAIEHLLPKGRHRSADAKALTLAADGAIQHAQFDTAEHALKPLERMIKIIQAAAAASTTV
jgi:AcrR family transcriptional regulator